MAILDNFAAPDIQCGSKLLKTKYKISSFISFQGVNSYRQGCNSLLQPIYIMWALTQVDLYRKHSYHYRALCPQNHLAYHRGYYFLHNYMSCKFCHHCYHLSGGVYLVPASVCAQVRVDSWPAGRRYWKSSRSPLTPELQGWLSLRGGTTTRCSLDSETQKEKVDRKKEKN